MTWKGFLTDLSRRDSIRPFPDSFMFGVANADHQSEAYDPTREDIRDVWERQCGLTMRGFATDFETRYQEDIELARKLGCKAFRFSIAWSRVEPAPGRFDDKAFDHYLRLNAAIRSADMEPIVTLHHFTWPVHVERRGGMISDDFLVMFTCYAAEVAERFGKDVRYWVTFNEPNQLIYGYIKPWWERDYFAPPGLPEGATLQDQITAVGKLIRNLFRAHTIARSLIKRRNPDAQVGANPLLLGLPRWLQGQVDRNASEIRSSQDLVAQGKKFSRRALPVHGEVDVVIAAFSRTPERAREVMFSDTYFTAGQMLMVKATNPATEPLDLNGKVIAVVKSSTAERSITALVPTARVWVERDHASALKALDSDKVDAVLADDSILLGRITLHPGRYKFIGSRLTHESYAAAVSQDSDTLLDVIDLVVRRFKVSGEWAVSCTKHLGRPAPDPPADSVRALDLNDRSGLVRGASRRLEATERPLPLADQGSALRRVQNRGHLLVAVNSEVKGFAYQDPRTGEFSGLEIDLARAVAKQIFGDANRVRFRPTTTQERTSLLRSPLQLLDPLLKQYSILSTAFTSNWWHLGMAGKLDPFLCPKECIGQQDFVGIDYYWGISTLRLDRIRRLMDATHGRFDQAPVWPEALYEMLLYHAELFPDLPILIMENGSVDVADGVDRANYIRKHIYQVQRAANHGVNIAAYICWSITSNREWGLAFAPGNDFGLYHIDLDTSFDLERVLTPAAATYERIISSRGVFKHTRER